MATYRALVPRVRTCVAYTSSAGDVEVDDVVAETFLVVWRFWGRAPSDETERVRGVFGVARNKVREAARATQRRRNLAQAAAAQPDRPRECAEEKLVSRCGASELLDVLPESQRDAVALTVLAGLSAREAAAALGCSPQAVSSRVHRARVSLRERVSGRGGYAAPCDAYQRWCRQKMSERGHLPSVRRRQSSHCWRPHD